MTVRDYEADPEGRKKQATEWKRNNRDNWNSFPSTLRVLGRAEMHSRQST